MFTEYPKIVEICSFSVIPRRIKAKIRKVEFNEDLLSITNWSSEWSNALKLSTNVGNKDRKVWSKSANVFFCYIPDSDYESLNKENRIVYYPIFVGLPVQTYPVGWQVWKLHPDNVLYMNFWFCLLLLILHLVFPAVPVNGEDVSFVSECRL